MKIGDHPNVFRREEIRHPIYTSEYYYRQTTSYCQAQKARSIGRYHSKDSKAYIQSVILVEKVSIPFDVHPGDIQLQYAIRHTHLLVEFFEPVYVVFANVEKREHLMEAYLVLEYPDLRIDTVIIVSHTENQSFFFDSLNQIFIQSRAFGNFMNEDFHFPEKRME